MTVKKLCVLLVLCLAAAAQVSVSASATKTHAAGPALTDAGTIHNGQYRNTFFSFDYKIPFGWVDRTEQMRQDAEDPSKAQVLLSVFERPPEATGQTVNSAVVIAAESVSSYPGLETAANYFASLTELTLSKGFKADGDPYDISNVTHELIRGDFSKELGTLTMHQSSVVMLKKGYALSFTFIGSSGDEVNELVQNLSFGHKPAHKTPK